MKQLEKQNWHGEDEMENKSILEIKWKRQYLLIDWRRPPDRLPAHWTNTTHASDKKNETKHGHSLDWPLFVLILWRVKVDIEIRVKIEYR